MNENEKREKVINGLEHHLGNDKNHYDCDNCQYGPMNDECDAKLVADVLALLKTQTRTIEQYERERKQQMWNMTPIGGFHDV